MVNWFTDKERFYGMTTSSEENVLETTFESGKKRYQLRNTTPKKVFNVSFTIKNRTEEVLFWEWYEEDLYSRANTVRLTDLLTGTGYKEYRMTSEPQMNNSQYPKECTISLREE